MTANFCLHLIDKLVSGMFVHDRRPILFCTGEHSEIEDLDIALQRKLANRDILTNSWTQFRDRSVIAKSPVKRWNVFNVHSPCPGSFWGWGAQLASRITMQYFFSKAVVQEPRAEYRLPRLQQIKWVDLFAFVISWLTEQIVEKLFYIKKSPLILNCSTKIIPLEGKAILIPIFFLIRSLPSVNILYTLITGQVIVERIGTLSDVAMRHIRQVVDDGLDDNIAICTEVIR